MNDLYPPLEPYASGRLQVDEWHSVYYEECGNPLGKPAVFLHGGPGGGCSPDHRRYWDPSHYRIILFDQRGCGRSTPHAELRGNSTWDLVADIETLRLKLGIEKWQVFGGSWGSTLALAYAQKHPERVTELILRGIFLIRDKEIRWFYQEGTSMLFPDAFQAYRDHIPAAERHDLLSAYYRRLTSEDPEVRIAAARRWSVWEGSTSRLLVDPELVAKSDDPWFAEAFARIECHYFVNKGFFRNDHQLLEDAHRIAHIPCIIVHGRYDVVCPLDSAWELKKLLPLAELQIVPDSGHSAAENGIRQRLVAATRVFQPRGD
ncbi:MAG: prolyl aminopeptidase [Verrucomicrobiota bacterium]|jgi:proline iminopeptidase